MTTYNIDIINTLNNTNKQEVKYLLCLNSLNNFHAVEFTHVGTNLATEVLLTTNCRFTASMFIKRFIDKLDRKHWDVDLSVQTVNHVRYWITPRKEILETVVGITK